jgi:hypothetical protein
MKRKFFVLPKKYLVQFLDCRHFWGRFDTLWGSGKEINFQNKIYWPNARKVD